MHIIKIVKIVKTSQIKCKTQLWTTKSFCGHLVVVMLQFRTYNTNHEIASKKSEGVKRA